MTDTTAAPAADVLQRAARPCLATATVPTPAAVHDDAERFDVELRHVQERVAEVAGEAAGERAVAALQAADRTAGAAMVAVVDEQGAQVWHTDVELPAEVVPGPDPDLVALLGVQQRAVPHAVVLVDRAGADIRVVTGPGEERSATVEGETDHIRKVKPGGWSQRRYQNRAEERWHENAELVADTVVRPLGGADLALLLLAGDETMIPLVRDALPAPLAEEVVVLDTGGRAADGSEAHLERAVEQAVRRAADRRREEEVGQVLAAVASGAGVTGRQAVLQALFEHRVDVLVLDPAAAQDLVAAVGATPDQVAADASVLSDLGLDAREVPLARAALAAAAATGARVVVVQDAAADDAEDLTLEAEEAAREAADDADDRPALQDGLAASLRG
jgi:hypothetical protein